MAKTEKQNMEEQAQHRSNIYGLLAAIYRREMTSDLLKQIKDPRFLGVLSNLGIELNNGLFQKPERELLEDLAVEYARLFLGPGKHISPHESVHHQKNDGQWGQLWGESTVAVKKFIESSGLHYNSDYSGLPDHISVELEFMQQVTLREEQAWAEGDKNTALKCLKKEKKFIKEHLARWIPDFCNKVIQKAELPLYREMAKLTKNFIQFEMKEIDKLGENIS
ncbi:MAG: TorD/DmsD family molecular chaperone [Planctomycetota bacterium]|jgi:TorA maturation chaperone TorD